MLACLNGGTPDGVSILKPKTISLMNNAVLLDGHGLGWFVIHQPASFYLEHHGGGPGFATFMRLYPKKGLRVAVLTNGTDLDRSGLADLLVGVDW
jgi:CubicO group peptidase (beta-lactamase class C family)